MKRQTFWKQLFKLHLVLSLLVAFTSCGKSSSRKNEVVEDNNNNWNNPGRYNTPIYQNPNVSNQIQQQINQVKGSVGCVQGSDGVSTYTGRRLNQMVTFSAQGYEQDGNSSTLDYIGALNPGPISNGGNAELYVGISVFGDLLFVTKYSSGFQVIGYNYTISFCESQIVSHYYGQQMSLPAISDQNQVVQLTNDSQTVIDANSYTGMGMVDSADITAYFSVNTNQYNYQNTPYGGYGNQLPFVTTFFPLN